ncbi:MAG TPA: 4Fe-4S binding protein [Clostridiaceae bacterium]|nr:4Fe-4S binding protein [Clostridiaceae bacterium]
MKKLWLEPDKCTGCGACADICPKNAITMKADECGFVHPVIDNKCVECGLCERVCLNRGEYSQRHREIPQTYAAWSKNPDIRFCSTTGGLFTELAKPILQNGGVVAGAQYNKRNLVEHAIVTDEDGLQKLRQSKYLQSDSNGVYNRVKRALMDGREVLFCGAPCQVAALHSFLGSEFVKLITVDFICRGINSPKAYLSWLSEIESEEQARATRVWFKYKVGGWKSSPKRTRIDFDDGHSVVKEGEENLFMHGYLTSNLYIRPCCGDCQFKGVPRQGDLTIADFWGIEKQLDDDKGTSLILINSDKGMNLFDKIKQSLVYHQRDFSEIFAGNVCFSQSVHIPSSSRDFLISLDNKSFSTALRPYMKQNLVKRILSGLLKRLK